MGNDCTLGYTFFLETIETMLFDYSIDIYRVPLHNIKSLSVEYLDVSKDVATGKVPSNRLNSIIKEIEYSFVSSISIRDIFKQDERNYLRKQLNEKNTSISKIIEYIFNRLSEENFYETIVRLLKEKIAIGKEKKDMVSLTRELIPELHNLGFSYEYIFHTVKVEQSRVKKSDIHSSDSISFFDKFEFKEIGYNIVFIFDTSNQEGIRQYNELSKVLVDGQGIQFEVNGNLKQERGMCKKYASKLKLNQLGIGENSYKIICVKEVNALDAYAAVNDAEKLLSTLLDPYYLLTNNPNSRILGRSLVIEPNREDVLPTNQQSRRYRVIKPHPEYRDKSIKEASDTLPLLLKHTRSAAEFSRLLRAISLHNASLQMGNMQSAFLCIWTALEVLCNGASKIGPTLVCVLELNYLFRRIDFLYQRASKCLPANQLKNYLQATVGESKTIGFAKLLLDETHSDALKQCYSDCSLSTYLINQLDNVHSLSNKDLLYKEVRRYGERISWHIERMYRARNSIVHAGEAPVHLQSLGEHLHAYFDVFIRELFRYFKRGHYHSVEEIITAIQIENTIYMSYLKKNAGCNTRDYSYLLRI